MNEIYFMCILAFCELEHLQGSHDDIVIDRTRWIVVREKKGRGG
jgi:hypothetical protein